MPSPAGRRYLSPLRYPGGKGKLASYVGRLIAAQPSRPDIYVEPYAGGAGVGLRLLFDEYVDEIVLNDLNPGVAAFWRTLFAQPDYLIDRVRKCRLNVAEWRRQRTIYESGASDAQLGFATLYLNRTNRSGILGARPIGGLRQTGRWKLDARFDREMLSERIRWLAAYATRVTVLEEDGADVVARYLDSPRVFIYADPPYLTEGDDLYLNTLRWGDHQHLAKLLRQADGWLVTYDADGRIASDLYAGLRCAAFSISHTAAVQHVGREYAIFSPHLVVPTLDGLGSDRASWL
jgi:DNA adenine methylase